jgi:hypothetical protein
MTYKFLSADTPDIEKVAATIPDLEDFFQAALDYSELGKGKSLDFAMGVDAKFALPSTEFSQALIDKMFDLSRVITPKGAIGSSFLTGFSFGALYYAATAEPTRETLAQVSDLRHVWLELKAARATAAAAAAEEKHEQPEPAAQSSNDLDIKITVNGQTVKPGQAITIPINGSAS